MTFELFEALSTKVFMHKIFPCSRILEVTTLAQCNISKCTICRAFPASCDRFPIRRQPAISTSVWPSMMSTQKLIDSKSSMHVSFWSTAVFFYSYSSFSRSRPGHWGRWFSEQCSPSWSAQPGDPKWKSLHVESRGGSQISKLPWGVAARWWHLQSGRKISQVGRGQSILHISIL